ncbi:PAS-domain containing protein [Marivibrio halodurans]|uniref:histidine kinase n=1 Tax=Marivibrio halodurans TaxID=2039722 RepID=A0A8J7V2V7_9PROT|nr:PAS domain-containing sensor histidine kinase [Marivibrio halodurans]MBP5857307.1 PAS-domain containing protein [Marivibrio halodurans]
MKSDAGDGAGASGDALDGDGAMLAPEIAAALDVLGEAFVIYDKDGLLIYCNRRFREIYGYSAEEARPGVHFRDLGRIDVARGNVVVGDEYGSDEAYLDRKAEYRRTLEGSFTVRLRDGRWLKTTDRAIPGGGFVSVQADVSDLKQAEVDMAYAKDLAERANLAKSDFLARMSHDLRTPLNSILGFSELLAGAADLGPEDERMRAYADAVHFAGSHLHALINDILDIAKVEAGKLVLEEEPVDLAAELAGCMRLLRSPSEVGDMAVCRLVAEVAPVVRGDARRLRQIFVNLISNALKFTPPDGVVELSVSRLPDGGCRVCVSDNGIGVAPEDMDRIVKPFEQGSGTSLRSEPVESTGPATTWGGSGLGLAIAKSLAELHDATFSLSPSREGGLAVAVDFPPHRMRAAEQKGR